MFANHRQAKSMELSKNLATDFFKFMQRACKFNQRVFEYKTYCKNLNPFKFLTFIDDRIRKKFSTHMQRKRKAETKFKTLLEKAIMTYADKASIAYP